MAAQMNGRPADHPDKVGNAFIEQYYHTLVMSPDLVHKFYHEESFLTRPGPDGEMTTVTTMQGINDKILSLNYHKYRAEIKSADSQASFNGGVSVLVTGIFMGEVQRNFTQSFFLAPQDAGYYVLNDMFRYVEGLSAVPSPVLMNGDIAEAQEAPAIFEPEVPKISVVEHVAVNDDLPNGKEESSVVENGKDAVDVRDVAFESPADSGENLASQPAPVTPSSPVAQGNGVKMSFASIVNALKNNAAPFVRASPTKVVEKPCAPAPAPEASVRAIPSVNGTAEKISTPARVKRHSIFVGNLPLDATAAQLEAVFKKFGAIKRNGIQVRSSKGSCYGFVEFETESSVQAAIEETSILIGSRTAHIEEQKNGMFSGSRRFDSDWSMLIGLEDVEEDEDMEMDYEGAAYPCPYCAEDFDDAKLVEFHIQDAHPSHIEEQKNDGSDRSRAPQWRDWVP